MLRNTFETHYYPNLSVHSALVTFWPQLQLNEASFIIGDFNRNDRQLVWKHYVFKHQEEKNEHKRLGKGTK